MNAGTDSGGWMTYAELAAAWAAAEQARAEAPGRAGHGRRCRACGAAPGGVAGGVREAVLPRGGRWGLADGPRARARGFGFRTSEAKRSGPSPRSSGCLRAGFRLSYWIPRPVWTLPVWLSQGRSRHVFPF